MVYHICTHVILSGFIKYALQYGYSVVPVFAFGERKTYVNVQGAWSLRLWLNQYGLYISHPKFESCNQLLFVYYVLKTAIVKIIFYTINGNLVFILFKIHLFKAGFPAILPWGRWLFPLLPRAEEMRLVVGPALLLPRIEQVCKKDKHFLCVVLLSKTCLTFLPQ